ncbi:hypothetical protein JCM8547_000991 [Rhodosporidiobolus lusitaniae]
MYSSPLPSHTANSYLDHRPSSRSSLRSSSPLPFTADAPQRPLSAGSVHRPQRGSFSPYDDETPSSSPTLRSSSRRNSVDDYGCDNPPLHRSVSGPRLPPLPVRSPIALEHDTFRSRPSSVVSTASTTRKSRPPSIHMTGPSPTSSHGFARYPSSSRPSRLRRDDTSSDDEPASRRSSALMPRSAVANAFNLDFSFLDEEPPPRPSVYGGRSVFGGGTGKERPTSVASERPVKPRKEEDDYFSLKSAAAEGSRAGNRNSVGSTASLPFPSKALPFPSRPNPSRRISSESVTSRMSSLYSPGERPYIPSQLSASVDPSRRPSTTSFMSLESNASGSSAPSLMYQSRTSPPPLNLSAVVETGPEAVEKRKRLAAFLAETANSMEGGKSLGMVLPESQPAAAEHKTLSEIAEARTTSPRPSSRASNVGAVEYRPTFNAVNYAAQQGVPDEGPSPTSAPTSTFNPATYSAPPSPTTADPSRAPSPSPALPRPVPRTEPEIRQTVYYTPNPADEETGEEDSDDEEPKKNRGMSLAEVLALDRLPSAGPPPAGLGFANVDTKGKGGRPLSERSPSTIRADSPASLAASQMQPVETEEERFAKKAEKRKRTIRELVETEVTYAVDMAVVRDIYLARARGAHMTQIADHVMSTGLGLGNVGPASPTSPALASSGLLEARRSSAMPGHERRVSAVPSLNSSRLNERRPTVVPSLPNLMPGQPLMSEKDLHVIFANLEEIAAFSEGFANLLDSASGADEIGAQDDRIGEVFVEMIPRIQQVYSTYCARHHRAILRLQELEPTLRTYFSECKTLSHGRTNAWDLASLLIKPVQRCLKYPLLLDQILGMTAPDHPDRPLLQRANAEMLSVAEHINEAKKRNEVVSRIVNKEKQSQRRDSALSAMGTTVTKKLLRSGQKAKSALGMSENGGDEMFDTLVALVDSTRSGVLRFSNEMRDWSKSTKAALEAQVSLVEGWIDMYAPMAENNAAASHSHRRLCIFLDEVLIPIIEGPWRELDHEVRRSLILKTDHLLSLFESPRQVIAKRNDKMLDHHRYLAKKLPVDRRGSEDFLVLSAQLLEELPRFLGSVSRYFNIIVGHFAGAQAAYHEAVQERWNGFAESWLEQISDGPYDEIEASFAAQHQPADQMMDTLACGLGLAVSQSSSPLSHKRNNRLSHMSTGSAMSSPATSRLSMSHSHLPTSDDRRIRNRQSYMSTTTDYSSDHRGKRGSLGSTNRSSVTSDSSAPSLGHASADGSMSTAGPVTPPPVGPQFRSTKGGPKNDHHRQSMTVVHEPLGGYDRRSMALRYDAPLPVPPGAQQQQHLQAPTSRINYHSDSSERSSSSNPEDPHARASYRHSQGALDAPRPREVPGRSASELRDKLLSTYSVYMPADDGSEDDYGDGPLYVAEAMTASESTAHRSGYPVLSFNVGDRFNVELEEADTAEGGSGWLLGRRIESDGTLSALGWARTEDFSMVDDEEGSEEVQEGEAA